MIQTITQNPEPVKHVIDVTSVGAVAAVLLGWLPQVLALMTAIATFAWACIRLYETKTVQRFLNRRKRGRK